jgi:hypothetical protein
MRDVRGFGAGPFMRVPVFVFALSLLVLSSLRAASLDGLAARADVWGLSADDFEKEDVAQYRNELETKPFRWVSEARDSARAAAGRNTLFGLPVVEAVARFEGGTLSELTATFYARGDAGTISKEKYEELVRGAVTAVDKATGVKMTPRGKDQSSAVKADGLLWQTATAQYLLEYSAVREVKTRNVDFRAEFVRLEVTPPPRKSSLLSTTAPGKGKFTGPQHVSHADAKGDVLIPDVPMVDQGQKGYCVVACAERLMRYYGIAADANEIAQIANSDAERGTNPAAMLAALKKVGNRLRVRVRQIEGIDVKEILTLIKEYNRQAKKEGQPQVPDPGLNIDLDAVFSRMNGETLKAVRAKTPGELAKFQHEIQPHVDTGIPVLWSVRLGLIKEPEIPQAVGGHMRLIIGYNPKTQEIIYTDSWGAGHEKKRMSLADACTITMSLATIEPLGS